MGSITIRNVDEQTKEGLRLLAVMHRRSMEAQIREILRESVKDVPRFALELYPEDPPDGDVPLAAAPETPLAPRRPVPPSSEVVIAEINRQLEKMGMSEFALPEDLPLG